MKNKDIDNMLNTLRKHSPNWIDRIRVYINKLENDLLAYRRPVGYSVVDVKLKAKKEVFDDIVKEKIVCNKSKCDAPCCISLRELKKRHLSTLEKPKQHNSGLKKDRHQS